MQPPVPGWQSVIPLSLIHILLQAVQGAAAGVTITQTASIPGDAPDALVRGQNAINAKDVYKRQGKEGKPVINVGANLSVSRKSDYRDYFDAAGYLKFHQDWRKMYYTYGPVSYTHLLHCFFCALYFAVFFPSWPKGMLVIFIRGCRRRCPL